MNKTFFEKDVLNLLKHSVHRFTSNQNKSIKQLIIN